MDPTTHSLPAGHAVQQLVPNTGTRDVKITPEREVLCIHRGEEPYEDMFDSVPYVIHPGYFMTSYGAALHFRARAVVPGSRNPETKRQTSFLAIIGIVELHGDGSFTVLKAVDKPEEWARFTPEEQLEYQDAPEALDRGGMINPIDREVIVAEVSGVTAGHTPQNSRVPAKPSRIKGGGNVSTAKGRGVGGSARRAAGGIDQAVEGEDPGKVAEFMRPIPAEDNPVVREAQQSAREAAAEGHRPR